MHDRLMKISQALPQLAAAASGEDGTFACVTRRSCAVQRRVTPRIQHPAVHGWNEVP
jgi:hypothetical protein